MKLLFVPIEACLDDRFKPQGDRFELAKQRIAFAFENRWRVYLIRCSEWGQQLPEHNAESDRYALRRDRWGIGRDSIKEVRNALADVMALLQPPGRPVMRCLFCPNQRSDLPTEMYEIRFNHRSARCDVLTSRHPSWTVMVHDGPGNSSFRLPSPGMVKNVLKFHEQADHRIAHIWHQEPDRVAASAIGAPLYSSKEWLAGVDPYDRSIFVPAQSVPLRTWGYAPKL